MQNNTVVIDRELISSSDKIMKRIFILILASVALVSGCSRLHMKDDNDPANNWTVERAYKEAKKAMDSGNYALAVKYYEFLETRYPFGVIGRQSLLDLAYVYYKTQKYDEAISSCDRFIKLYPQNPAIDYAYYLKGLVDFSRGRSATDRFLGIDESQRDPANAKKAYKVFQELADKYPHSRYMKDAQQRMVYLRNLLAQYEINIANYYMRRGAFIAAADRASYVIKSYERSTSVPKALVIMAKCYKILEMNSLYEDTLRVLRMNYPNDPGIRELEKTHVD